MPDPFYTAFLFDHAVTWFGRYIESKLSEHDKKGKPLNTLDELLQDTGPDDTIMNIKRLFGTFPVKVQ